MDLPYPRETLKLYHGTIRSDADAILQGKEIKILECALRSDFGRGFYTTSFRSQAQDWADVRMIRERMSGRTAQGAVLRIDVDVHALSLLRVRAFGTSRPATGNKDQDDSNRYWEFVRYHRNAETARLLDRPNDGFDVVIGPVANTGFQSWARSTDRSVWAGYDQISFHTDPALALITPTLRLVR